MPDYDTTTITLEIPSLTTDIVSLLKSRLGAFYESIRRQPRCRWGLTSGRVFLLDGDIVDVETQNGIDIPDEIVGEARAVAAEENAIASAWALPHDDAKGPWWFVSVELPGLVELQSSSRLDGRTFGAFAPWELWELGPDAWTVLPVNLPRWAEVDREYQAAPAEPELLAGLRERDYAAEIASALATQRDRIASGTTPTRRNAAADTVHCLVCGTRHTRDATGRLIVPSDAVSTMGSA